MEAVMASFKVLSHKMHGAIENKYDKSQFKYSVSENEARVITITHRHMVLKHRSKQIQLCDYVAEKTKQGTIVHRIIGFSDFAHRPDSK
jgi:hypothetical protein